jgi:hypothetical protein
MRSVTIIGAVVLLLGLLAFAIPVFTTSQTKDVAKLGDFKVQTQEQQSHAIPPLVSVGAIVVGAIMLELVSYEVANARTLRSNSSGSSVVKADCFFESIAIMLRRFPIGLSVASSDRKAKTDPREPNYFEDQR